MNPLTLTHVLAACMAVVLGAWQLLAAKRGLRHRGVGYLWMVAMTVTALSSFGLRSDIGLAWLGGFSWIHGLSLFTLLSLVLAVRYAIRRDFANHRRWVLGAYMGLAGAGVAAVAAPERLMNTLLFVDLPRLLSDGLPAMLAALI
ncbi:MAG: DUF2306 domain-containing protein [Pseudomonadota bacterium]|jgi:uncharacterized membrane protein|nr:DUF2306 domain-containing protein [Pseudomonadota bacterium]